MHFWESFHSRFEAFVRNVKAQKQRNAAKLELSEAKKLKYAFALKWQLSEESQWAPNPNQNT